MALDIKIEGDKELIRLFNEVPKLFPDKVIREIARKGAAPILSDARKNVGFDGQLDSPEITKKAVVIAYDKQNPSAVRVTVSNRYVTYKGKRLSVGKIYRHLSAGPQNERTTKSGLKRGKAKRRYGDFIQRAFERRKDKAVQIMNRQFMTIIKRKLQRYL